MRDRRHDDALPAAVLAALEAQHALAQALHRGTTPEWVHLDLTMGQLKTLMTLVTEGDMNVSGLAERLRMGKPAASILVDRLVQLGYVERTEDAEDRRRTLVTPTAKGRELVAGLQQGSGERMVRWLEQMEADDLAALTRGLRALTAIATDEGESLDDCAGRVVAPSSSKTGITATGEE
jgi:DNA-binding MarR family transcriptional regulator